MAELRSHPSGCGAGGEGRGGEDEREQRVRWADVSLQFPQSAGTSVPLRALGGHPIIATTAPPTGGQKNNSKMTVATPRRGGGTLKGESGRVSCKTLQTSAGVSHLV